MNTVSTSNQSKTAVAILFVLLSLFVLVFVLFAYTFLHESGHAITGLIFGQTLTEFDVNPLDFDAHVGMIGDLTDSQNAIQSAAGAGLPLLIWFLFIGLVPRKAGFLLEALKLVSAMAVVNTLLAWILLPILHLMNKAPADDVTNFLRYSQMPPLLLIAIAITLYVMGWAVLLAKIDGLRNEFLLFRNVDLKTITAGAWTTLPAIAGFLAICTLLTLALNSLSAGNSLSKLSPPPGFESVAQVELSTQAYADETLAQFSLNEPASVGVFFVIRNIDTTYFDLSVAGPGDYHSIVLHGEEYFADQDGGLWQETLPPGTYQLILTSHQSPGMVSVYMAPR